MNLYEFLYTRTKEGVTKERKYQVPATSELNAAVILGQTFNGGIYCDLEINIISCKKVK